MQLPRKGLPYSTVLGALSALLLIAGATVPLRDIDMFWHIRAGEEILATRSVHGIGATWPLVAPPDPWTSTQWLAEVLFFTLHSWSGWVGIALFTVSTTAIALLLLARTTLRGRPVMVASWPFALAAFSLVIVANDRPQQATLIGAAVLGGVLDRGLRAMALPRWWVVVPLMVVWGNFHGGWVLAPVVFVLVAIRGLAAGKAGRAFALKALALAAVSYVAGGLLTPAGAANITAVLRYSRAAADVTEWQKVEVFSPLGMTVPLMAALLCLGWARSNSVMWPEMLAGSALLLLGVTAWRNVAPSLLMLSPLVAGRLTEAFPATRNRIEPEWSVRAGLTIGAMGVLLALPVGAAHADPADPEVHDLPISLAAQIGRENAAPRVLNEYNLAGVVLFYTGNVQVGIDGRADYHGVDRIDRYLRTLALQGDFEAHLEELRPNLALVGKDSAMRWFLTEVRDWRTVGTEGDFVLLRSPGLDGSG